MLLGIYSLRPEDRSCHRPDSRGDGHSPDAHAQVVPKDFSRRERSVLRGHTQTHWVAWQHGITDPGKHTSPRMTHANCFCTGRMHWSRLPHAHPLATRICPQGKPSSQKQLCDYRSCSSLTPQNASPDLGSAEASPPKLLVTPQWHTHSSKESRRVTSFCFLSEKLWLFHFNQPVSKRSISVTSARDCPVEVPLVSCKECLWP